MVFLGIFSIWQDTPSGPTAAVRPSKLIRGLPGVTQVNMLMMMNMIIMMMLMLMTMIKIIMMLIFLLGSPWTE